MCQSKQNDNVIWGKGCLSLLVLFEGFQSFVSSLYTEETVILLSNERNSYFFFVKPSVLESLLCIGSKAEEW